MKRIGGNLRPAEQKPQRNLRNIIRYSDVEPPQNAYPKRIVSPAAPGPCCKDENRDTLGNGRVIDGFKLSYKICRTCGHAVRYFSPAAKSNDETLRQYRAWKRYMVQ